MRLKNHGFSLNTREEVMSERQAIELGFGT